MLRSLVDDSAVNLRAKLITLYALLVAANIAAWAWAISAIVYRIKRFDEIEVS
ncbi:MAG: hypothetical protein ABI439_06585 [Rhodospirillales bacterium]